MKQVKRIIGTLLSAAVIFPFAPKAEAVSLAGLSAKAAILIDAQTGTVIAEKNVRNHGGQRRAGHPHAKAKNKNGI